MPRVLSPRRLRGNSNVAAFRPSARWQLQTYCGICGAHFSYVRSRHHCRHCGMSVCGRHSRQRAVVPSSLSTQLQRVCDTCFPLCREAPRRPRGMTVGSSGRSTGGSKRSTNGSNRVRKHSRGRDATESTYTDDSISSSGRGADLVSSPRPRSPRTLDVPWRGGSNPNAGRKRAASAGDSIRSMHKIVSPMPPVPSSGKKADRDTPSVCVTDTTSTVGTLSEVTTDSEVILTAKHSRPLPFRRKASRASSRRTRMSRDESMSSFAIFSFASDSDDSSSDSSDSSSDSEGSDESDKRGGQTSTVNTAAAVGRNAAPPSKKPPSSERPRQRPNAISPPTLDRAKNRKLVSVRSRTAPKPPSRRDLRGKESLDFGASSVSVGLGATAIAQKYRDVPSDEAGGGAWDPAASVTSVITRKYLQQSKQPKQREQKATPASESRSKRRHEPHATRNTRGNSAAAAAAAAAKAALNASTISDLDDADARKPRSSSVDSEECFSDEEAEALARWIADSRRRGRGHELPAAVPEEEPPRSEASVLVQPEPEPKPKPIKPKPTTTATYRPKSEDLRAMQDVDALERRILQVQGELPALFDEWREVQARAKRALREVRESRARVARYQKAQAVVARAMRAARSAMAQREFLAAILELTRAAAIERTNPTVWFLLAQCRLAVRQLEDAEEACMTSVSLQPTAAGVALLGRILQELGRHDEAIECYLSALGREELPK